MNRITDGSGIIQTSCESVPSTPCWFGEVALIVGLLRNQDVLTKICERVRFARRRLGYAEVIDCLAVLFGDAISGEGTLETLFAHKVADFWLHFEWWSWPFLSIENTPGPCPDISEISRKSFLPAHHDSDGDTRVISEHDAEYFCV